MSELAAWAIVVAMVVLVVTVLRLTRTMIKLSNSTADLAGTTTAEFRAAARRMDSAAEKLEGIHDEVRTMNGQTIGALGDKAEGRRIAADVPEADRTDAEQGYVDHLDASADPAATAAATARAHEAHDR